MRKLKILSIGIALCLSVSTVFAQKGNSIDGLIKGKLLNGLTYYILHSELQKGEASFYLVQKAGSILENDNQNGLAHFLEHMAFNGSKHFPNGVSDYLKSQGVTKFNAYTSYDETVYNIDDVRSTNKKLTDTCIYLLRDWCGDLLLSKTEIDKERGVIEEEWRSKLSLQQRRKSQVSRSIFYNTKYKDRDVIGDMNIVRNFKPQTLRNFYNDWYRADIQAVIIVGDIDAKDIETKVKTIFSDLKVNPKAPKLSGPIRMVSNSEPLYEVFKDKEVKQNNIQLFSRFELQNLGNFDYLRRENQFREFFNEMAQRRLVEFANANEEQFFKANLSISKLLGSLYGTTISVTPFPNKDKEALKQVLGVLEQIKRFGFSKAEVEKQKTLMYAKLESASNATQNLKNTVYITKLKANYFNGIPTTGIDEGIAILKESLLEIEATDINTWVKKIDFLQNLVAEVDANEKRANLLSKEAIVSVISEVQKVDIAEKTKIQNIDKLVDFDIIPGKILSESAISLYDAKVWNLANGAKVIYKHTNQRSGDFAVYAHSFGGKSVLEPNQLPSANALVKLATKSGIYKYDRNTMTNFLRTKRLDLNLTFDEISESLKGSTSIKDADMLFQFVYLFFTKPRFDKEDFDIYKQKLIYKYQQDVIEDPMVAVSDSIRRLTTEENDRSPKMGQQYINAINFESMKQIYMNAFGDVGDFTFYIVGDLDEEKAKYFASTYIASLPTNPLKEANTFKNYNFAKKDKVVNKRFEVVSSADKALIDISYLNDLKIDKKEKLAIDILVYTLRNRYFKTVREEFGGTYGVKINPIISSFPADKQQLSISFETDRNRVDELKPLIYKEILQIKKNGIFNFELQEALDYVVKANNKDNKVENGAYWLNVLTIYQEERKNNAATSESFTKATESITSDFIKSFATKFFDSARLRDIVVIQRKPEVKDSHPHTK